MLKILILLLCLINSYVHSAAPAMRTIFDAARSGDIKTVQHILTNNPNAIDGKDRHGDPLLYNAVQGGSKDMVEFLIMNGADIDATAWGGTTALMSAVKNAQSEIVQLLLQHGAETTFKDYRGMTVHDMVGSNPYIPDYQNSAAKIKKLLAPYIGAKPKKPQPAIAPQPAIRGGLLEDIICD